MTPPIEPQIGATLELNEAYLRTLLHEACDIHYRHLTSHGRPMLLVYAEALADLERLSFHVLRPLQERHWEGPLCLEELSQAVSLPCQHMEETWTQAVDQLLKGDALLFVDGLSGCLVVVVKNWEHRSIQEPKDEASISGPSDSFIENLTVNRGLIRRRLPVPDLCFEKLVVGDLSRTQVELVYLRGVANLAVLDEVRKRLQAITTRVVLSAASITEFLEGVDRYSPFPLFLKTERPDKVVAALVQGQIVVMVDNTPRATILPATLSSHYLAPDDSYFKPPTALFVRSVRLVGTAVTVYLAPLYIAFATHNHNVLRAPLVLAIAASREGVPYPPFIEVILMETMMEMITEATLRLPRILGGAATIVGGLIIGQAAANAHIISNLMIVVTAGTAIGNFSAPSYEIGLAWRIVKVGMICLAIPFGIFGVAIGTVALALYLASLESFGVPYLDPWAPFRPRAVLNDSSIFRAHWPEQFWFRRRRTQGAVSAGGAGLLLLGALIILGMTRFGDQVFPVGGHNAWLVTLAAGAIAWIGLWATVRLQGHGGAPLTRIASPVLRLPLGLLVTLLLVGYSVVVNRQHADLLQLWQSANLHIVWTLSVQMLLIIYGAWLGPVVILRALQFLVLILGPGFLVITGFATQSARLVWLFPLMEPMTLRQFLSALPEALALFCTLPLLQVMAVDLQGGRRPLYLGWVGGLLYCLYLIMIGTMKLGAQTMARFGEPLLVLFDTIRIQNFFLDRLVFMYLFIMYVVHLLIAAVVLNAAVAGLVGERQHRIWWYVLCALAATVVSILIPGDLLLRPLKALLGWGVLLLGVLLPLTLLMVPYRKASP